MVERLMRELGRRLKKMAHNWSDVGAGKIARIIVKRVLDAEEWERFWKEKLRIENKVNLTLEGVYPVLNAG